MNTRIYKATAKDRCSIIIGSLDAMEKALGVKIPSTPCVITDPQGVEWKVEVEK